MTRRLPILFVALTLLVGPAFAGGAYQSDLKNDLGQLETKIVSLAESFSAENLAWGPEGVRTSSQVMMHIAGANFFFAGNLFKQAPPEGINPQQLEAITDQAQIVEVLKKSFASAYAAIDSVPDDQLMTTFPMFGRDTTKAAALAQMVAHSHEHLGQLIAYTREMGVVPPWSK